MRVTTKTILVIHESILKITFMNQRQSSSNCMAIAFKLKKKLKCLCLCFLKLCSSKYKICQNLWKNKWWNDELTRIKHETWKISAQKGFCFFLGYVFQNNFISLHKRLLIPQCIMHCVWIYISTAYSVENNIKSKAMPKNGPRNIPEDYY